MLTTTRGTPSRCTQEAKRRETKMVSRWTADSCIVYPREKHKFRSENSPEIVDTISFSNRMQIMDLVTTASPAPTRSFSRNPVRAFYQSSIGKKITVAVTGIILIVFVV